MVEISSFIRHVVSAPRRQGVMVFTALALVVACGSKSGGGGGSCVDVSASNYDTSCQSASDCTAITAGHLCSPACICPNALINASGLAQWQKDVSGLTSATPCECPPSGAVPSCVSGTCAYVDVDAGSDAAAE